MHCNYPPQGNHGANILAMTDSTIITEDERYSIAADLGNEASLRVVISDKISLNDSYNWYFDAETVNGWDISEITEEKSQTMKSTKNGHLDGVIIFSGQGTCTFRVYENDASEPIKTFFITTSENL